MKTVKTIGVDAGRAFVIGGALLSVCLSGCSPSPEGPKEFTRNDALMLCRWGIERVARDPETVDIPYVENMGKGDEYYYAWGRSTKFVRMKNGLGLEVPVSASCTVDRNKKEITTLSVNGKTII